MIEILLFSFSISIDALGYSIGFGSRNVTLKVSQFFVLNLINSLILSLFLWSFSSFKYFFENPTIAKISPILLAIFGACYVFNAFFSKIKPLIIEKFSKYNCKIERKKSNVMLTFNHPSENFLRPLDLSVLFLVFIFENAFSTFVFYSNFNNALLFVLSNFVFHFMFFLLGFNIGKKLVNRIEQHTSFVSGFIFLCLSYVELFL